MERERAQCTESQIYSVRSFFQKLRETNDAKTLAAMSNVQFSPMARLIRSQNPAPE